MLDSLDPPYLSVDMSVCLLIDMNLSRHVQETGAWIFPAILLVTIYVTLYKVSLHKRIYLFIFIFKL